MSTTIQLLKILGSPFTKPVTMKARELKKLYTCAKRNRISFFFLENIRENYAETIDWLHKEEKRYFWKTNNAIIKLSKILTDSNIPYSFFKTIRPYKSTTVDLDVLIFEGYSNILKIMHKAGYTLLTRGPRSSTFLDPETNIKIDLYEQIATGFITYLDKQSLTDYAIDVNFSNNIYVKILKPEADLACIIAHSIIKEQMYTLSEYFSFIYYLKELNLQNFLRLIEQNNILNATRTHTTITALLHRTAHERVPWKLQELLRCLGEDNFESARVIRKNFNTPHKYHPITVAKSLLELTKGRKARQSFATQLFLMLNPRILKEFANKFINHMLRETY